MKNINNKFNEWHNINFVFADLIDVKPLTQYVKDNFLNPYRRESGYEIFTTGQILSNLTTLTLQYNSDRTFCEFIGYERLLPEGYDSKLKFELTYVEENSTLNNNITNSI